jgi:hypothetical protein
LVRAPVSSVQHHKLWPNTGEWLFKNNEPIFGWIYDGVYQQGDTFIPGGGFEQVAGGENFREINGLNAQNKLTGEPDGRLNNDDHTIIGNPHPDFIYGWNNEVKEPPELKLTSG